LNDVTEDEKSEDVKPGRKIAMIGTAPSTRGMAPFDNDWEVWCQADYWADLKRIDRWFEFAPMVKLQTEFPDYLEFLKGADFPVWMRRHFDEIPRSRPFPFTDIAERYGKEFMSATVVWMMAMALIEHEKDPIETIGLWGYDLALDSEYESQRPGVRHMEWVAKQAGITVLVPQGSDLLITPIPYPFADDDPRVAKIRARKRDLQKRINFANRQAEEFEAKGLQTRKNIEYLKGALEDVNYFERMACGAGKPAA